MSLKLVLKAELLIVLIFFIKTSYSQNTFPGNGNVGIGATNPSTLLQVSGNIGTRGLRVYGANSPYGTELTGDAGGWAFGYNFAGSAGTALGGFGAHGVNDGLINFYIGSYINQKVSVHANGNVGIGTTSPSYKLQVNDATTDGIAGRFIQQATSGSPFGVYSQAIGAGANQNVGIHGYAANGTYNIGVSSEVTAGANNYSLYTFGTAKSYFAGNVGIGTVTPAAKLDVNGSIYAGPAAQIKINGADNGGIDYHAADGTNFNIRSTAYNNPIIFSQAGGERMRIANTGNVGINNTSPVYKLDIIGTTGGKTLAVTDPTEPGFAMINTNANAGARNWFIGSSDAVYGDFTIKQSNAKGGDPLSAGTNRFYIDPTGNVGIGTTNPTELLSVKGTIIAQKVKVLPGTNSTAWPDYVFHPTYKLRTLSSLEAFINQYNHLPDVPSASEVEKDGVDIGLTQAALLKKIEELTLYVIEQNKEIIKFKQRFERLERETK